MTFTPEQMNKAKSAKSAEELAAMAAAEGVPMTAEEAAKYFTELHRDGELTDEELTSVAGGSKGEETPPPPTEYYYPECIGVLARPGYEPPCPNALGFNGCGFCVGNYYNAEEDYFTCNGHHKLKEFD